MKNNLQQSLLIVIEESLKELGFSEEYSKDLCLDLPTDCRFGDLSTNIALKLSRITKKALLETANDLANLINQKLKKSHLIDYVQAVKVQGAGFINFYLHDRYFYEQLKQILLKDKDALRLNIGRGRRVLIEFVSANPTGPLSVAHARQAAVGDCLANILKFLGFKVKKEYYLNDEGNQIDILAESVRLRIQESEGKRIEFPENYYRGEYIYEIARKMKNQNIRPRNLQDYAIKTIQDTIKEDLQDFGVKFDYWYSQKKLRKSGKIEKTLELLKKKQLTYEKDGALWFKSVEFGDEKDRVVIKSDGAYTYLAPDIAYHQEKYSRGFGWLINLWGPDHHGYIKRIKAAIKALGYPEDSLSIIIVQLASIFKEGHLVEMSTRKGQYITLREILDEVGPDASRFFFLMRRTNSHLDFDLDVAKKQTPENPVYYVQYAHARICSILRKRQIKNFKKIDLMLLKEKEEMELIKKILQFTYILNICLNACDPYMMTVYLKECAQCFHKFYDLHRVLGIQEDLTCARLSLIQATKTVIGEGLSLLGISRTEKM